MPADDLARQLFYAIIERNGTLTGEREADRVSAVMDLARHLASVVSRRDADLRTRIEAVLSERVTPTLGLAKWADRYAARSRVPADTDTGRGQ
jgi:hypothetical protein